jgi:hypothetical protein
MAREFKDSPFRVNNTKRKSPEFLRGQLAAPALKERLWRSATVPGWPPTNALRIDLQFSPVSGLFASANDLLIQACPQAIEWPGRAATAYGLLQPKVVPFLDHIHAGSGGQIVYPVVYPGAFFDPTGARNFQKPLQLGMSALGQ